MLLRALYNANVALATAMAAEATMLATMFKASPSYPYRGRSAGDRAHKRWKRARASGRR